MAENQTSLTPAPQHPQSPGSQLERISEEVEGSSTDRPPREGTPIPESEHVAPGEDTSPSETPPRLSEETVPNTDAQEKYKIFVGGLSWETDDDGLRKHFETFGNVVDATVKYHRDQARGLCEHRGFGFVQFAEQSVYDRVLDPALAHVINGKAVEAKPAFPITAGSAATSGGQPTADSSSSGPVNPADPNQMKKVFVGGIGDLTEEELRQEFEKSGPVAQLEFIYDKQGGGRKGFCFVSFGTAEAATNATKKQFHEIGKVTVEVKRATSKQDSRARWMEKNYGGATVGGGGGGGMTNWQQYYGYPYSYYGQNYGGYYGGYDLESYYANPYASYGYEDYRQYDNQQGASRGGGNTGSNRYRPY